MSALTSSYIRMIGHFEEEVLRLRLENDNLKKEIQLLHGAIENERSRVSSNEQPSPSGPTCLCPECGQETPDSSPPLRRRYEQDGI